MKERTFKVYLSQGAGIVVPYHCLTMDAFDMLDIRIDSPADRVADLIKRVFIKRSLTCPTSYDEDLRDLGLSSLDMVNLVLSVESEFNVMIPEIDITPRSFRSISTISALVTSLLPAA